MLGIQHDSTDDRTAVLALRGSVVAASADRLERECLEWRRSGFRVVLDLERVVFMDRFSVKLLGRLRSTGVRIVGCSRLLAAMLMDEGIAVNPKMRWRSSR